MSNFWRPHDELMVECKWFLIDIGTLEETFGFLTRYQNVLPKSGRYLQFLQASSRDTTSIISDFYKHKFFEKVFKYFILYHNTPKWFSARLSILLYLWRAVLSIFMPSQKYWVEKVKIVSSFTIFGMEVSLPWVISYFLKN